MDFVYKMNYMKVTYSFIKLKPKEKNTCMYCSTLENEISAVYRLETIDLEKNESIDSVWTCENCKKRFDEGEIEKCADCGRPRLRSLIDCLCVWLKKREEELGGNPDNEDYGHDQIELQKQIHELSLEKQDLETAVELSFEAIKSAEKWDSRKELIEENKDLTEKRRRLSDENKKLKDKVQELEIKNRELEQQLTSSIPYNKDNKEEAIKLIDNKMNNKQSFTINFLSEKEQKEQTSEEEQIAEVEIPPKK
jgi:hypothetical protein